MRLSGLLLSVGILMGLGACAGVPAHHPVPEAEASKAVVEGFPANIRFWADESPAFAGTIVGERLDEYRAANADYFKAHGSYPPLNYLAISGGANDGAFGAGFLSGWYTSGTRPDFEMVTGISTGALIAPYVFVGAQDEDRLRNLYTNTSTTGIFQSSLFSVLEGLSGGLAVTDNAPLVKMIDANVTPELVTAIAAEQKKGKRLFIGTTNLEAQRGVIWDIGAIASSGNPKALDLIREIILASVSVPGVFAPVFIHVQVGDRHYDEIHADGGLVSQVFIYPLKLKRSVIDEFDRYHLERRLYVLRNGKIVPEYDPQKLSLFGLTSRSLETFTKYQGLGDLYRLYIASKRDGMDFNLVYIPDSFDAVSKQLFDPAYMRKLYDAGYTLGLQADSAWKKQPPGVEYEPETTGDSDQQMDKPSHEK
ncbi:MAG TPA: patatin-like phospholipase family protein [Gammaproteobacteria bacterium]|nr:patatin-like phospholipase family protein [Gammaproteobacteria bacterium]